MLAKKLGQFGETIAANFLRLKGYRIVERNFRTAHGELDLVCKKADQLIFVEVKTRSSQKFGYPEEAITKAKLAKLEQMAQIYCQQNDYTRLWRLEAVSIIVNLKARQFSLKHLTDL